MTKLIPLYENGSFFVVKAAKGYEVYENGLTHATRRAILGSDGDKWFQRAKEEADQRALASRPQRPRLGYSAKDYCSEANMSNYREGSL